MMSDAEIKKHLKLAIQYGMKKRLNHEQAEDLAQRYVLKKFVDKKNQTLEQAYIDFTRSEFGDYRCKSGEMKSASRRKYADLDDYGLVSFDELEERDMKARLRRLTALLTPREFFIYTMFEEGFTGQQIGDMLGLSNGRIFQIKKVMLGKMIPAEIQKDLEIRWIEL